MAFGAILGASLYFSVPARADYVDNYTAIYWSAVCSTLDSYPSIAGVTGVIQGVAQDSGFSYFDSGRVVGESVVTFCPRHTGLLNTFIAVYAPKGQVV